MSKIIFVLGVLFSIARPLCIEAQLNVVDFAQIINFKSMNERIKAGKAPKVVFIGNSITEGWVYNMPQFFMDNNFAGRGIGGQTSAQVLLRFRNDVVDLKPQAVIIEIGTNDVAENGGPYDEAFTLGNIASMIEIAKSNKIKVILGSVIPASSFNWRPSVKDAASKIRALNVKLKEMATRYKITYLDYHTPLANKAGGLNADLAADGVHPTLKCYEKMATLAKKTIDQVLPKKP
ncbi:MAG: hypothetical protein IPN29_04000 [Saprospiraceae bacterium]|nr:hypothetical protein [Saprospiraceae bacterium]